MPAELTNNRSSQFLAWTTWFNRRPRLPWRVNVSNARLMATQGRELVPVQAMMTRVQSMLKVAFGGVDLPSWSSRIEDP